MAAQDGTRTAFAERQEGLLRFYDLPARSRYLDIERPQMRVHLLEAGEGEPLVLLHGGDGEGALWAPLMAALKDDLRLYALDRPGCGLSDAFDHRDVDIRRHAGDFVTSVLDAPGLESATLVACSMGGFFALATALDRPERVRRLALVGMPVGMSSSAPLPLRLIAGVPGLSSRFMKTRGTLEAQRAQYKRPPGRPPGRGMGRVGGACGDAEPLAVIGCRPDGRPRTGRRLRDADGQRTGVLLVDDHAILRSALRLVLGRAEGIDVRGEAGSAEDALAAVVDLAPDVVIMDLRMPGLGGIDGTLAVKELSPATRVLVLSMLADGATVRRAMAAGADGYVPKTATDGDLVRAIRAVAAGERAVDPSLGDVLGRPAPPDPLDALTPNELAVARLVALGHTTAEIGAQLGTGSRAVEHARSVAFGKLGARTRAELVTAFRRAERFGTAS